MTTFLRDDGRALRLPSVRKIMYTAWAKGASYTGKSSARRMFLHEHTTKHIVAGSTKHFHSASPSSMGTRTHGVPTASKIAAAPCDVSQ